MIKTRLDEEVPSCFSGLLRRTVPHWPDPRKADVTSLEFCAKMGSSGKFRQSNGKRVGKENEEPSLSWIWNQRVTGIRRTRYEKGEIIFELEPNRNAGSARRDRSWMRRGFRWREGAHGGHRAKARGVEGEGAAMVEHDDGRGIRAVPPFVEAYTKITRKLGCLIVDLARFMTLSDIAGWLTPELGHG